MEPWRPILGLDLHGVIANFELGFLEQWKAKYPGEYFVPLEKREKQKIVDDYPEKLGKLVLDLQHSQDFIINLPEYPGAIDAIKEIMDYGTKVIIVTSPRTRWRGNIEPNYEWVAKRFGDKLAREMIIVAKDKTLVVCDILIDDNPIEHGAKFPCWDQVLFTEVNNKNIPFSLRMNGWTNWKNELLWHLMFRIKNNQ
jgi:5'(3')-deoxyribonucleotidase